MYIFAKYFYACYIYGSGIIIERLICARHSAWPCKWCMPFRPLATCKGILSILHPREPGSGKLNNPPEVVQLWSGSVGTWTQAVWLQNTDCSVTFHLSAHTCHIVNTLLCHYTYVYSIFLMTKQHSIHRGITVIFTQFSLGDLKDLRWWTTSLSTAFIPPGLRACPVIGLAEVPLNQGGGVNGFAYFWGFWYILPSRMTLFVHVKYLRQCLAPSPGSVNVSYRHPPSSSLP